MRAVLTGPAALRGPIGVATTLILDAAALHGQAFRMPGEGVRLYLQVRSPDDDLAAVVTLRPDGIVLAACEGGRDVARLGVRLAVLEAEAGSADGAISIIAMISTPGGVAALATLPGSSFRLGAIAWDATCIASSLGGVARDAEGALSPPLAQVRSAVRLTAAHARVEAFDSAFPDHAHVAAFLRDVEAARRDGFAAKLAISAEQGHLIASS